MKNISIGLVIMAIIFFGLGVWGFLDPVGIGANVGFAVGFKDGINEMRAIYGGFMMGIGIFLAWSALDWDLRKGAWLFLALGMGFIVLGRGLSFILDGPAEIYHQGIWGIEIIMTVSSIIAYRKLKAVQG